MGGFRARDADRERYVDVIEAAYVDGQLGEQDRELRVSRALTAETLDELEGLTRDLQNRPAPPLVRHPPSEPVPRRPQPEPRATPEPGDRVLAKVVWLAVAAVLVAVVMGFAATDDSGSMSSTSGFDFGDTYPLITSDEGPVVADYRLSADGVQRFVRRYQARFDTPDVVRLTLLAHRVDVVVPGRGSGRPEAWTWNGVWRLDPEALQADDGASSATVDLRTLDVEQLVDNIEVARRDLGVERATTQRVEVRPTPDGVGTVTIRVRNSSSQWASLETTPQGARVRASPFEG